MLSPLTRRQLPISPLKMVLKSRGGCGIEHLMVIKFIQQLLLKDCSCQCYSKIILRLVQPRHYVVKCLYQTTVMYLCVRGVVFASVYGFHIWFCNYSYGLVNTIYMYQRCEFKSRRRQNNNWTAQKSNANTVWFNFQTYIYVCIWLGIFSQNSPGKTFKHDVLNV